MKRIFCILIAVAFLSGCALTTIQPAESFRTKKSAPAKTTVVEKVREVFRPEPKPAPVGVQEKEEILPLQVQEEEIK